MRHGHKLQIGGKEVVVYPSAVPSKPIVYLNTFAGEGDRVHKILNELHAHAQENAFLEDIADRKGGDLGASDLTGKNDSEPRISQSKQKPPQRSEYPDYTLVAIGGLDWNHDMAPWGIPPISKDDIACTAGADEYLRLMIEEIMPKAESLVQGEVSWRGISGYSLAGLFALYAICQTGIFSRVACMSASFWFPGFKEYVFSHPIKGSAGHLYFSLGDMESHTENRYLKPVQANTEEIESFYRQKGLDTTFVLNPGDHYDNPVKRTAEGILWILNR